MFYYILIIIIIISPITITSLILIFIWFVWFGFFIYVVCFIYVLCFVYFILFFLQKVLSNLMLCWCQKAAYLITFIMHHGAGHLYDGIRLEPLLVRSVTCKCVVLLCFCHVVSPCSRALNLYAVQNILKVCILNSY